MPVKNVSCHIKYFVEDLQNGGGLAGDSGNHTLKLIVDDVVITPSSTIVEPDASNMVGWYRILINDDENTGDIMVLGGSSSTSSTSIRGIEWFNERTERFDVDTDVVDANIVQVSGEYVTLANFQVGGASVAEIADAVWDEPIGDHVAEGSAGQVIITTSGILLDSLSVGSGIATTYQLNNWGLILLNHLRDTGIEP